MASSATQFDTDCKLMLPMDGADAATAFPDSSASAKTVTAVGNAQIDTGQSKFGGASGLFDGAGDRLTVPDSPDWSTGTGDFTIDFWVRPAGAGNNQALCASDGGTTDHWSLLQRGGNSTLRFQVRVASAFTMAHEWSWSPSNGTWYHVAVTRSGNSWRAFIDGTQIGSTITDAGSVPDFSGLFLVGSGYDNNANALNDWQGHIENFRYIKGTAVWTGNFTPPSAAYTSVVVPNYGNMLTVF